ncbi:MAG: hypothetical protein ACRETW_06765 [Stenotrophobium sp.]
MRDLEERYKFESKLDNRSQYKIFYGLVRPAEILVLGINPGGNPLEVSPDGTRNTKKGVDAAASATYYENDECDLLDCDWTENTGLKKLLIPLLDNNQEAIRQRVVKSNLAFRRSAKATAINIKSAKVEAASFLAEIISLVSPRLIILTSGDITLFAHAFSENIAALTSVVRDEGVRQVVYESARVRLRGAVGNSLVVRVAHASQFSWTYRKHNVVDRIKSEIGKLA